MSELAESRRVVLKWDPYVVPTDGDMELRLTYDGPLLATQRDAVGNQHNPRAPHKHELRRVFHRQLKRLWTANKFLRETKVQSDDPADKGALRPLVDVLAYRFRRNGYRFVPLVCEQFSLLCSVNILMLRPDLPGGLIQSGDIDNRLKTVFDALRMPRDGTELGGYETPGDAEDPFFVLLEDDQLISHTVVETDMLLEIPRDAEDVQNQVRLVITVNVRPYDVTMFNVSFA